MGGIFRIGSPFNEALTKIFDMIALNLVFLFCCLPVVTIGASCTALHTVTMKMANGDDPHVVKGFFSAFRSNFRQSTLSWLLLLLAGGFLYVDSVIAAQIGAGGLPMRCILGFCSILYLFILLYIFQIQGYYHNTIRQHFKNALLIAIRQLPKTVLLAATIILPVLLALYGSASVFLLCMICFLLIGCALIACIQDKIVLKVFDYYNEMSEDIPSNPA